MKVNQRRMHPADGEFQSDGGPTRGLPGRGAEGARIANNSAAINRKYREITYDGVATCRAIPAQRFYGRSALVSDICACEFITRSLRVFMQIWRCL